MKSGRPLFRQAGFFPFPLLFPLLSAEREHASTPIPCFCSLSPLRCHSPPRYRTLSVLRPVCCRLNPVRTASHGNPCRFLRTCCRNAHYFASVDGQPFHFPGNYGFPPFFGIVFLTKSSSFSDAKIVCRRERLWKS